MNGQWCIACHGRVPSGELIERLFRASGGERWTLSHDEFATVVQASVTHAFPDGNPPLAELERYCSRLHLADLALAAACALGRERDQLVKPAAGPRRRDGDDFPDARYPCGNGKHHQR